tara:strand:- start:269 stop:682 length:414 start_codon:yes stop_codon:yes gene_type:complete
MSCDRFIYKVSWFSSKKHLNSWRDEYYITEEQTRFIYEKECDLVSVYVIKVCVNSAIYKKAKRPDIYVCKNKQPEIYIEEVEVEKVEVEDEIIPPTPPPTPEHNINMVIDSNNNDLWLRDANGRRVRDKESDWDKYR